MTFTDDFNRANENVEASANWTRVGGSAGDASIVSNIVECNTTLSTGPAYQCPDQGSGAKYTQADLINVSGVQAFCVGLRVTDGANFFGVRHNGTDWQCYKRVATTFTLMGSYTAAASSGDTVRIEDDGSDNFTVKINGTSRITFTDTFNNTETRQGFLPRFATATGWLDNFEAGLLAGGATSPWYYYANQ